MGEHGVAEATTSLATLCQAFLGAPGRQSLRHRDEAVNLSQLWVVWNEQTLLIFSPHLLDLHNGGCEHD